MKQETQNKTILFIAQKWSAFYIARNCIALSIPPYKITKASSLPVIILTQTPRLSALRIVSALSCRGGSNNGNKPQNVQGPPGLSLDFSGIS